MSKIEEAVIERIRQRAETGFRKYGKTMERTDLVFDDWVIHLQEELLDAIIYLERLKQDFDDIREYVEEGNSSRQRNSLQ